MFSTIRRSLHLLLLLPILSGCASLPAPVVSRAPPTRVSGIVIVADGAGGNQSAPRSIAAATDELRLPLHVRSFEWTHGKGRGLSDILDVEHARCQGRQLAEEVCQYRGYYPYASIYLVGFSAGSTVVLAAADLLPPDTLERIVLLAPSVSASYDLRVPLASARQGIDVFTSERDRFYLGLGTDILGTTDGKAETPAGRFGFCPPILAQNELWLAARLRQHPWNTSASWTGNEGEHAGSLRPAFLKAYVLPLLAPRTQIGS